MGQPVETAPQSTQGTPRERGRVRTFVENKILHKDQPLQRHLRVVELPTPEYGRVRQYAVDKLRQVGFLDTPVPLTPDPEGVLIPRGHFGIKRLRSRKEEAAVADAMIDLAAAGNQGTRIKHNRFEIWDEKERRWRGGVKKRKLRQGPFGWEKGGFLFGGFVSVDNRNRANLRRARRAEKKAKGTDSISLYDNPIKQALKDQRRVERRSGKASKSEVLNGMYSGRAKAIAWIAEASPFRAKDEFSVGLSRAQIYNRLSRMMARLGDAQLDPSDMIHGPFEAGVKQIHEAQEGFSGALANIIAGRGQEKVDLGALAIVVGNKLLSTDTRKSFIDNARTYGTLAAYFLLRQRLVHGKDWLKTPDRKPKKLWALTLPGIGVVETAVDRRANQHDLARFADVEALLGVREIQDKLLRVHQKVVAEEFIRAYEAAPGVEGAIQRGMDKANQGLSWITDKVGNVVDDLPGVGPIKKVMSMVRSNTNDPHNDALIQEANEAYAAAEKQSKKAHVAVILSYADRVLATNLSKVEREHWEAAKKYARKFYAAFERAKQLTQPALQTASEIETAPEAPVVPVATLTKAA